jgi:hypothetical protein
MDILSTCDLATPGRPFSANPSKPFPEMPGREVPGLKPGRPNRFRGYNLDQFSGPLCPGLFIGEYDGLPGDPALFNGLFYERLSP